MKLQKTPTKNLSEEQWQQLRSSFVNKGMIGGSDAGTLLGLNQYKAPINLFYQALGIANLPNKMNGAMLHGKNLEKYVADCWQYYDGTEEGWVANTLADNKIKKYRLEKSIIVNPQYPNLFANVDGIITKHPERKSKGLLEIKTISGYAADSYKDGIPPSYLIQVQHYMLITGYTWGEICYLKDGRELGVMLIEKNANIQQMIVEAAEDFQQRFQAAKKLLEENPGLPTEEQYGLVCAYEPPADSSKAFEMFISEKHKARGDEVTIQGDESLEAWARQANRYRDLEKKVEEHKRLYQNKLKQHMEQHAASVMLLPNGKITWRKQFNINL